MSDKCLCQQNWEPIVSSLGECCHFKYRTLFMLLNSKKSLDKFVNIAEIVKIDLYIYELSEQIKQITDFIQKVRENSNSTLKPFILLRDTYNYLVPKICDKCAKNFVKELENIISEKNLLAFIKAHNARDKYIPETHMEEEVKVYLRWNVEYRNFLKKYGRRYNNVFNSPLNKELEDVFEKRKTFMTSPVDASIEDKYECALMNFIEQSPWNCFH